MSQVYPYLGASPDGAVSCNCCDEELLEIKYPWTSLEKLTSEYIAQPESCLTYDDSNKISLENNHSIWSKFNIKCLLNVDCIVILRSF